MSTTTNVGAPYLGGDVVISDEYGRCVIMRVTHEINGATFGRVWVLDVITTGLDYVHLRVDDDGHDWTAGKRVRPADCEEVHTP